MGLPVAVEVDCMASGGQTFSSKFTDDVIEGCAAVNDWAGVKILSPAVINKEWMNFVHNINFILIV